MYPTQYLGITLDRTLTFKTHLTNVASKINSRINIIQKLIGTDWGADFLTLRTSTIALVYSVVEYCSPVWLNSTHAKKVDIKLNQSMRITSGTIKTIPLDWLPVLNNIISPQHRRQTALLKLWSKLSNNTSHPMHEHSKFCNNLSTRRLKSRKPPWETAIKLNTAKYDAVQCWKDEWEKSELSNSSLIKNPINKQPGFNLPRRIWTTLNRLRTGHGRVGYFMHKWGITPNPGCDCGAPNQNIDHIIRKCPKRKFGGKLEDIFNATPEAIEWVKSLDIML